MPTFLIPSINVCSPPNHARGGQASIEINRNAKGLFDNQARALGSRIGLRSESEQTLSFCINILIQVHIQANGYVDDVFVCAKVLKVLQEKYSIEKLAR